jgi:hypothetical protein
VRRSYSATCPRDHPAGAVDAPPKLILLGWGFCFRSQRMPDPVLGVRVDHVFLKRIDSSLRHDWASADSMLEVESDEPGGSGSE